MIRLDKHLLTLYPDFSRSRIEGLIKAGYVTVNGAAAFAALSENERRNASLKLKIGETETEIRPTDVAATWARIGDDRIGSVALTPSNLVVDCLSHVTASVGGLPSGLNFDRKTLAITGTLRVNEGAVEIADAAAVASRPARNGSSPRPSSRTAARSMRLFIPASATLPIWTEAPTSTNRKISDGTQRRSSFAESLAATISFFIFITTVILLYFFASYNILNFSRYWKN